MAKRKAQANTHTEVISLNSVMMDELFTRDEAGRLTHRYNAPYRLPLDDRELDRHTIMHDILKQYIGGNVNEAVRKLDVPWSNAACVRGHVPERSDKPFGPRSALDVGCGRGTWAIEFGEEFPKCHVTAFDLAPCQPRDVPPNVFFEVLDFTEDGVDYNDATFDLVHHRLVFGVPSWSKLLRDYARVLRPGGMLVCIELGPAAPVDNSPYGPAWTEWLERQSFINMMRGYRSRRGDELATRIRKSRSFFDVTEARFDIPLGPWPHDEAHNRIGALFRFNIGELMESYRGNWLKSGFKSADLDTLIDRVQVELADTSRHIVQTVYLAYGYRT